MSSYSKTLTKEPLQGAQLGNSAGQCFPMRDRSKCSDPWVIGLTQTDQHHIFFFGKITAKAIYDDLAQLLLLNYVRVHTREFIGFPNATWATAVKTGRSVGIEPPPLNVIEVDFKRPQVGKPLEIFWKPARGRITERIGQCGLKYPHSCHLVFC